MSKAKKTKQVKRINKNTYYYLVTIAVMFALIVLNYVSYTQGSKNKRVLGVFTTNNTGVFWYQFLQKNPSYIPGWIEIGRIDKVKKLDPNYF
jgi:hypothetical protein